MAFLLTILEARILSGVRGHCRSLSVDQSWFCYWTAKIPIL